MRDEAVRSDPAWSDDLDEVELDDGDYYTWGDDGTEFDPTRRGPFHGALGRGGQLAVEAGGNEEGSIVTRTIVDDDMQAAIEAGSDGEPTALEEGPLVSLVDGVGEGDVVQAFALFEPLLFDASQIVGPNATENQIEEFEERFEDQEYLDGYLSIMAVELVDGEETRTEIIVSHDDDEAAAANVEPMEMILAEHVTFRENRPVSELFADATVEQRDEAVVVTVPGSGNFRAAFQAMTTRDIFLAR